jgi:hypothetical protein
MQSFESKSIYFLESSEGEIWPLEKIRIVIAESCKHYEEREETKEILKRAEKSCDICNLFDTCSYRLGFEIHTRIDIRKKSSEKMSLGTELQEAWRLMAKDCMAFRERDCT